ncbi:MAG: aminoglycoside phosphotransferase family protein [Actinomycetota bacterium]
MSQQPSPELASWIADVTATSAPSFGSPLPGASTATVWPVEADGRALVAKVFDRGVEFAGEDHVRQDVAAMNAAAEVGLDAPRVVASDPDGERLGVPALVMTRLPGEPRPHGRPDGETWVDGLAETLIAIGEAGRPTAALPLYRSWYRAPIDVPPWTSDPGPWRAVNEVLVVRPPNGAPRFIHRDFHPFNVLWDGGRPTGTVDWVNGCLGPIESDVGTCRMNIVFSEDDHDGHALADRFLRRCLDGGLPWDPVWDLSFLAGAAHSTEVLVVGATVGARVTLDGVHRAFDRCVVAALAALEAGTD